MDAPRTLQSIGDLHGFVAQVTSLRPSSGMTLSERSAGPPRRAHGTGQPQERQPSPQRGGQPYPEGSGDSRPAIMPPLDPGLASAQPGRPGNFSAHSPDTTLPSQARPATNDADQRKQTSTTSADSAAHRSLSARFQPAESADDLGLYVVAGLGFEPT